MRIETRRIAGEAPPDEMGRLVCEAPWLHRQKRAAESPRAGAFSSPMQSGKVMLEIYKQPQGFRRPIFFSKPIRFYLHIAFTLRRRAGNDAAP